MGFVGMWWDADLFAGGYRLSGDTREIRLGYNAPMLDGSVFGDTTKRNIPGLPSIDLTVAGLMPETTADDLKEADLFDSVGLDDNPITVFPTNTPAEGDLAYFFKGMRASLQLQGQHGALYAFTFEAHKGYTPEPLIRGAVLEPGRVMRTTNGQGTGTNRIGAVPLGKYLYAILHAVARQGTNPTLDVVIESDDNAEFTSPTTRVTFAQVAGVVKGIYAARIAGPITDTYWRARRTIGGADAPGYTFAAAVGVAK